MQSIPEDAKFFAKLDAVHGYFQLALDEDSSFLNTFLIPLGRYRYLRVPMGHLPVLMNGDSDFVKEGCELAKKIVDDMFSKLPNTGPRLICRQQQFSWLIHRKNKNFTNFCTLRRYQRNNFLQCDGNRYLVYWLSHFGSRDQT